MVGRVDQAFRNKYKKQFPGKFNHDEMSIPAAAYGITIIHTTSAPAS
jgi:hypothetical protein